MRILLLVHLEETFRHHFDDDLLLSISNAIESKEFDRVIHFTSHINDDEPVFELAALVDDCVQWGWGYEPEVFDVDSEDREFVIESSGHDWTWVPPELREMKGLLQSSHITLGGGYDGECLADMESVLLHLEIPFIRRREFIYP
jgi:hypothetical protein